MRRVVPIILALLMAALLGAAWYAYHRGFTKKWRSYVQGEFRKRGVEIYLRQLALEPFRGIVARDVKVYDTRDRRRTVAVIDEVLLVINYANFFKGQPFVDALELREARVALPLDPADPRGPAVEVRNIHGRLLLPPHQIYLSHFEANLYGVRVSANGRLINPGAFKPRKGAAAIRAKAMAARTIEEFKRLSFETEPPRLTVQFSGDLAVPGKVLVEAALSARSVRRGNYRLANVKLEGCLREGALELKQVAGADRKGALRAGGRWELDTGEATLHGVSTLDAAGFLSAFGGGGSGPLLAALGELRSDSPPALDVTLNVVLGETVAFRGYAHAALGRFTFRTAAFESLESDFSWDAQRWSVRDFRMVHRTGVLGGEAIGGPGDFRLRLQSTLNPRALLPVLPAPLAELLAAVHFIDSPQISVNARGAEPRFEACTGQAVLKTGRAVFREADAKSLDATFHFTRGGPLLIPFRLERLEGAATGSVLVDFAAREVRLENVVSGLNAGELRPWFTPEFAAASGGGASETPVAWSGALREVLGEEPFSGPPWRLKMPAR